MTGATLLRGLVMILAAILSTAAQGLAAGRPFDHSSLARQMLERHIVPGYQRLADAANKLSQTLDSECAEQQRQKPNARPRSLDNAFNELVMAWGRIEHINFGPITKDNRLERILFFPDRRGVGARQVAQALDTRDPAVTDVRSLAKRSVALQGLGALESVLFGADQQAGANLEAREHRCRYAAAIAANLSEITRAMAEEWTAQDGFRATWLTPGAGNPVYVAAWETTVALAKAFDQGLERVRDERVAGPLGLNRQRRKMPAVFEKSGRTLVVAVANLDGLLDFYEAGGLHEAISSAESAKDGHSVSARATMVANELRAARDIASKLVGVGSPFGEDAAVRHLTAMGFPLKNAREQAAALLTETAGLTRGFNSSDGD